MSSLCKLCDGDKQRGISRINLDVKYLRSYSGGKEILSGKFTPKNKLQILVDGENSGEVFRTPIDGYQGSTFKQLDIDLNMNEEYVLQVINLNRKLLRESKVGSAIPHLNKKLFREITVFVPPFQEQCRIIEAIRSVNNLIDKIAEEL